MAAAAPLPEPPPPGDTAQRLSLRPAGLRGRIPPGEAPAPLSPRERARRVVSFLQTSRLTPIRDLLEGTPGRGG